MVERYVRDVEAAGSNPVTSIIVLEMPQTLKEWGFAVSFCFHGFSPFYPEICMNLRDITKNITKPIMRIKFSQVRSDLQ